jgi:hypothetical protein
MNKKVNSKEFHVMNCLGCNHIGFNVWEFFIKWPKEMGGGRSLCFETAQDAKDFLKSECEKKGFILRGIPSWNE